MALCRSFLLLLTIASFALPPLHAADKAKLAARMKSGAEITSLDSSGLQPWHMAMQVTLFDVDGKNPKPATVELWAADNNMRMVESVGDLQVITVRTNDKLFRTSAQAPEFSQLEMLIEQILHPIPDELLQAGITLNEEKPTLSGVPLDCIEPSFAAPDTSDVAIGHPLSFCFKKDTDNLILSYTSGGVAHFRQQIAKFQAKEVPIHLEVLAGPILRSDAKLTKLETYTPQPGNFTPMSDMPSFDGPIEAKPGDLINAILSKRAPIYPASARTRNARGSVSFDAIIGPDGHILSLQPVGQAAPDLTSAAETAVRQWIYRPLRICGIPVRVKTTITINFTFGS
jgi:hypothetical protein